MNTKELETMTLQEIKDLYKTLSNPVPVVGTGKNGCKVKQNWIEAVQKTVESEPQPEVTEWEEIPEDEQIPFYDPDYRPDPEEELINENGYRALSQREKIKLPISFGWTADRLLSGMKTVTRRTWQDKYAQIFIKAYQQGKLVPAFDKDRRYGGKLIGHLKLTCEPYKEFVWDLPPEDVKAEGYPELEWDEFLAKFFADLMSLPDDNPRTKLWVIRFEFYPLETEIDDIPLIDETPKDTSRCELNTDQQMLLESYKFEKIGHAFEDSPFVGRDPYCSLNGWDCYFSYDNSRPQKMTLLSLVNYQKGEWWGARLNYYSTTKNRERLKRYAQKIILELSLCLEQKTGVKA